MMQNSIIAHWLQPYSAGSQAPSWDSSLHANGFDAQPHTLLIAGDGRVHFGLGSGFTKPCIPPSAKASPPARSYPPGSQTRDRRLAANGGARRLQSAGAAPSKVSGSDKGLKHQSSPFEPGEPQTLALRRTHSRESNLCHVIPFQQPNPRPLA